MRNLELCCECDEPTDRAGQDEDSLYAGHHGPYCEHCWGFLPEELAARVDHLERVNTRATSEADALRAEVEQLREALRKVVAAGNLREHYHHLPNERARIGSPKSAKGRARDAWIKAFRRAETHARAALKDTT